MTKFLKGLGFWVLVVTAAGGVLLAVGKAILSFKIWAF